MNASIRRSVQTTRASIKRQQSCGTITIEADTTSGGGGGTGGTGDTGGLPALSEDDLLLLGGGAAFLFLFLALQ